MKLDANLLKSRRTELSMTQELLAKEAGYDVRTIQRAEAGKPIQSNVAACIAQVLDIAVDRLKESQIKSAAGQHLGQGLGAVDLVECRSGRVLLQQFRGCHFLEVEYDFEARSEHRDTLMRLGALIDENWIDPLKQKRSMFESLDSSQMQEFENMVKASEVLEGLADTKLKVLSGTYTAWRDRLVYDKAGKWEPRLDQGSMQYRVALLCVTDASKSTVRRHPEDHVEVREPWPMAPYAETRF